MTSRSNSLRNPAFKAVLLAASLSLTACGSPSPNPSNTSAGLQNSIALDQEAEHRGGDGIRVESEMNGRSEMHNTMRGQANDGSAMGAHRMGMGPDSVDNAQGPANSAMDPAAPMAAPMKDDM